jgi:hypothetical protein
LAATVETDYATTILAPPATPVVRVSVLGSAETAELHADERELKAIARSVFVTGGAAEIRRVSAMLERTVADTSRAVRRLDERLVRSGVPEATRRGRADTLAKNRAYAAVLATWRPAVAALYAETSDVLEAIETRARELAFERIDAARDQVRSAASRYLVDYDVSALERGRDLKFPSDTRLGAAEDLLIAIAEVSEALTTVRRAQERADRLYEFATIQAAEAGVLFNRPQTPEELRALGRCAAIVDLHGGEHPIVYRITTATLSALSKPLPWILEELERTWNAANSIATHVLKTPAADMNAEDPLTSMLEERFGGHAPAEVLNDDLEPPSAILNDALESPDEAGPWAYPILIEAAVTDVCGLIPSVGATAAEEALGEGSLSDELATAATVSGAQVALTIAAPPIGLVVDVALAAQEVASLVREHRRLDAAAAMALDPRLCLAKSPSAASSALRIAGAVASVLPGKVAGTLTVIAPLVAVDTE